VARDLRSTSSRTQINPTHIGFRKTYPVCVIFRVNQLSVVATDTIFKIENSSLASNFRLRQTNTGARVELLLEDADTDGTAIFVQHADTDKWHTIRCIIRSSTNKELNVVKEDQSVINATSTATDTWSTANDNVRFGNEAIEKNYIEHVAFYDVEVPMSAVKAIARGRHPLDFPEFRRHIIFYQPLVGGYNEDGFIGPHVIDDPSFTVAASRPRTASLIRRTPRFLPATFVSGVTHNVSISEGVKLGDTFADSVIFSAALAEGVKLGDTFSSKAIFRPSWTEGVKLGDTDVGVAIFPESWTEGLKYGDTWTSVLAVAAALAEGYKLGDTWASTLIAAGTLAEGIKFGDAFSAVGILKAAIAEGSVAGDTFVAAMITLQSITEGIKLGDTWTAVVVPPSVAGFLEATVKISAALSASGIKITPALDGSIEIKPK